MDYYKTNIEEIKKQGFETMNFTGYGGTGYKKGTLKYGGMNGSMLMLRCLKIKRLYIK